MPAIIKLLIWSSCDNFLAGETNIGWLSLLSPRAETECSNLSA